MLQQIRVIYLILSRWKSSNLNLGRPATAGSRWASTWGWGILMARELHHSYYHGLRICGRQDLFHSKHGTIPNNMDEA